VNNIAKLAIFFLISFSIFAGNTYAEYSYAIAPTVITDSSDWVMQGAGYSTSVSGIDGFSSITTGAIDDGLWANITVNEANCPGYCLVRLQKNVGLFNGDTLRAELRLEKWENSTQAISYRIRTLDTETGSTTAELAKGYFGTNSGQQWTIGTGVNLAAAIEGNDFIFYTGNNPFLTKKQLLSPFEPFRRNWLISVYTETAEDFIAVTVKDFLVVDVN